eukprot:998650-Prorocentrum_minimum.AAC.4
MKASAPQELFSCRSSFTARSVMGRVTESHLDKTLIALTKGREKRLGMGLWGIALLQLAPCQPSFEAQKRHRHFVLFARLPFHASEVRQASQAPCGCWYDIILNRKP